MLLFIYLQCKTGKLSLEENKYTFCFSSDDMSVASTSTTATATSSPVHHVNSSNSGPCYSEEYYTVPDINDMGQNEHYIYVTYPPELKRRLLER
jgi:hypothetical protein